MRTAVFVLLILATTTLSTLPFVFKWANRIEPTLLGLPFAFLWQIGLALLAAIFFVGWYLADERRGRLDVDVAMGDRR